MRSKSLLLASCLTVAAGAVAPAVSEVLQSEPGVSRFPSVDASMRRVRDIEFLGQATIPTGFKYKGTVVGGLSGIVYDPEINAYYAISDDRSEISPARYYKLSIDLGDGALQQGEVAFRGVTTLTDGQGKPFPKNGIDPEGIALVGQGQFFFSSEGVLGDTTTIPPFVNRFNRSGKQVGVKSIPEHYLPDALRTQGVRSNLAFESLVVTPDEKFLFTATENALAQDGPAADIDQETLSRVLKWPVGSAKPVGEFVYLADPVAETPDPAKAFRTNGLVELLATDNNGSFLALERSYSTGKGNRVKLYEARTQGALDVKGLASLADEQGVPFEIDPPVAKRELLDVGSLGIVPDNLEGMTFGPYLPDGRRTLILVSDNNFSDTQVTQFVALAVDFETFPAAQSVLETPNAVGEEDLPAPLHGDSDDPAIWLHPTKPAQSLVICAQKDGGLVVFDLKGKVLQVILPGEYGDVRYNNVDLVYGFNVGGKAVDIAVASDRENDTLAVFAIDPATRRLTDITSKDMLATIFGFDDGSRTAYGLATYRSPVSGQSFVYVTQRDGHLVAQLALHDDGQGGVTAQKVRLLELPIPANDPEESQAEGMVVDREMGYLYVGMEGYGILKFRAEPDGGNAFTLIHSVDADYLEPDVEGLTLYYGANGAGYLLASSQGDNTYAVFDRQGNNAYLGSFVVAGNGGIDQANESDGADVLNVPLGPDFPYGLLVVQDGANDPQVVIEDDGELENVSNNFKFVPWQNVARAFPKPLLIDPQSYDPRQPR